VGGDFYDFFQFQDESNRLGVLVADVVDKGMPAALFMALCRTMIRTAAFSGLSPAEALVRSNRLIRRDSQSHYFLSAFYGLLDLRRGTLTYTNAGHNPPSWVRPSQGEISRLASRGVVIGVFDEIELEQGEITLDRGDSLVCYTDGLTEAMDPQGQSFGTELVDEILRVHHQGGAQRLLDAIAQEASDFTQGVEQSDDLTLLVVKRL
jgi:sigma-B regulation protein RsbU (phosphoserine phosphatase)